MTIHYEKAVDMAAKLADQVVPNAATFQQVAKECGVVITDKHAQKLAQQARLRLVIKLMEVIRDTPKI